MFRDSDWRNSNAGTGSGYEDRYSRDSYPFSDSSYERSMGPPPLDYGREYRYDEPSSFRGGPPDPGYSGLLETPPLPPERRLDPLDSYPGRLLPPPPSLPPTNFLITFKDMEPGSYIRGEVLIIPPSTHMQKPTLREKPPGCKTIFVGGLPDLAEELHLRDVFMDFGNILTVRLSKSGKKFCHIRFDCEEAVDKAVKISGYRIRVGPGSTSADVARIHVDYSQNKNDQEEYQEKQYKKEGNMPFSSMNMSQISTELHNPELFEDAAKNTISWFDKGHCGPQNVTSFFGMLSTINVQTKRLSKDVTQKEKELGERVDQWKTLMDQCDLVGKVYQASRNNKRAFDSFTKPQRKMISQWEEYNEGIRKQIQDHVDQEIAIRDGLPMPEPPTKKSKQDDEENTDELKKEIEYLKNQLEKQQRRHDMNLDERDKQIYQLKSLMAHFKEKFPREWGTVVPKTKQNGSSDMVDDVELGDLQHMMKSDNANNPLAAAAAEYAKTRTKVAAASSDRTGGASSSLDLTDTEVAMATVIATFLAVHPLGATIGEITRYFQAFNPQSSGYYLQGLLTRLPRVFQMSQSREDVEPRWWFLGYQSTSHTTTAAMTTMQFLQQEDDEMTIEMANS